AARRDLREPAAAPEELAGRDREARPAPELLVLGTDRERLLDPIEAEPLERRDQLVEVGRPEALVKIDAHREVRELVAQPRERREAGRGLRDRAIRAVDRLERRALERAEALLADDADDRRVVLQRPRGQRAIDRRVQRQACERRAIAEQPPYRHLLALREQVVERLVQPRERGRGDEIRLERRDLALLPRERLERQ